MIYEPLTDDAVGDSLRTKDSRAFYRCCELLIYRPEQAQYHLWRGHGIAFQVAGGMIAQLQAEYALLEQQREESQ